MFKAIDIAVVDDGQYQSDINFKMVLNDVSKGDGRLFNLTVTSKEKAIQLLNDNKIKGYILVSTPTKLIVSKSGIAQNIIKSFIDNYSQTFASVTSILQENPEKHEELLKELQNQMVFVKEVSGTQASPDNTLVIFYALIAMACFYGNLFGNREVVDIQANISPLAARLNVAPVHKLKTFLYSSCASLLIHFAELLVLLAFLIFALKIDFGMKTGLVLVTSFVGSVAGISFGAFISALVKKSEGVKLSILIGTTLACSFLSGMMYHEVKYVVSQNVPILSFINPVNLLTDALYSLYYYDTLSRFLINIMLLCLFIVLFCSGTYFILRRRKYASL
jgi:ABC-2 type transport system permease protein